MFSVKVKPLSCRHYLHRFKMTLVRPFSRKVMSCFVHLIACLTVYLSGIHGNTFANENFQEELWGLDNDHQVLGFDISHCCRWQPRLKKCQALKNMLYTALMDTNKYVGDRPGGLPWKLCSSAEVQGNMWHMHRCNQGWFFLDDNAFSWVCWKLWNEGRKLQMK